MRVLFLGARPDPVPPVPYNQRFEATGKNTGNLLIGAGLKRQLAFDTYGYGQSMKPEEANDKYDLIAVAAANFVYHGFDLAYMADYIEKTNLPVLTVGLGAQMPNNSSTDVGIPAGTQKLLKLMSERGTEIGVRGEFTASVLGKLGVKNVTVTGCPSYYWNLGANITINKPEFHPYFRISVNGSRNVTDHSFNPEAALYVENELLKFAQRHRHDYVLQNEYPEFDVFHADELSKENFGLLSSLSRRHSLRIAPEHYAAFVKTHCKIFFDIEEWSSFIKTKDLSIGSRIHGNLIALINGVPAVLFAHDSRTTEMAEFMAIPYHSVEKADLSDVRALYEAADFDRFTKVYAENFERYKGFLGRNKVPHKLD